MKNASFSTIIEDLKISFRFAYKNAISYLLALFGVVIVSGLLIVVVAATIFIPMIFIIGIDNLTTFFESFSGLENTGLSNLAVGSIMFALPFIAPFMVAIGALFGMGREVVESEGTSVGGVFTWYKKKFLSLAGGGLLLFLIVVGPLILLLILGAALYGDQFLTIAVISSGPANFANPIAISLLLIWVAVSTGLLSMLFPSMIDGYSALESIKRSVKLSIRYFDRVFGIWMAFLVIFAILTVPMFLISFVFALTGPALWVAAGLLTIYAIPAMIILVFFYLPAVTIGLTRTYMIVTADDEYVENLEDESGPSFIGGV
ncbi:hypothetical protein EU528_09395 [Candidatus Thorarchaeota archaeon]|nr:MAG: hypothetical protein EU528_09395 [Candidatus Thorarchaeota archaeon]